MENKLNKHEEKRSEVEEIQPLMWLEKSVAIAKKCLTIRDAIKSEGKPIGYLCKHSEESNIQTRAELFLYIDDLNRFYNIGNEMNASQIGMTIDILLSDFWFFRLDDVLLFLRYGKSGKYGAVFNRMDGGVILDWARKYDQERSDECVAMNAGQKLKEESEDDKRNILSGEELSEQLKKIINNIRVQEHKKWKDWRGDVEETNEQWLEKRWISQFELLKKSNRCGISSGEYGTSYFVLCSISLKRGVKCVIPLDLQGFLKLKFERLNNWNRNNILAQNNTLTKK